MPRPACFPHLFCLTLPALVAFIRRILQLLLTSKPSREKQILTISLSVLVAILLWTLVTLNQEYESTFNFPIRISEVPDSLHLEALSEDQLVVVASGLGIDLMVEHLRLPGDTIGVPFDELHARPTYLGTRSFRQRLDRSFISKVGVKEVNPQRLDLPYQVKASKRVPVRFDTEVRLRPSYQLREQPYLRDDSVNLYGPPAQIGDIYEWPTDPGYLTVERDSVIRVPLAQPPRGVAIQPKAVAVDVSPQRYTETQVRIPIKVTELPEGYSVRLQDSLLTISCLIPVQRYQPLLSKLRAYRLRIPFSQFDPAYPYLVPPLEQLPEEVKLISRHPQFLSYVIVEEHPSLGSAR